MATVSLTIDELLFNTSNPRFSALQNQRDSLQQIVRHQGPKLTNLAHDIATQGLSPAELIIVVKEDEHTYVVLEGNRRLAALKLLTNPDLLNTLTARPTFKKRFNELASRFIRSSVEPIECALVESSEEANHWIELRHTGENEGAGIVRWDGVATARFRGDELSLQAIEFVKEFQILDANTLRRLETFPITNLDRLLGDPAVRRTLGVETRGKTLVSSLPQKTVAAALAAVISDIAHERITVSNIRTKEDRVQYIASIPSEVLPDHSSAQDEWTVKDARRAPPNQQQPASPPVRRVQRIQTARPHLIPSSCKLNIQEPRINAIYRELRDKIRVDSIPNATAVLFRVFLELSVNSYIKSHSSVRVKLDAELRNKIDAIAKDLHSKGLLDANSFKPIQVACSKPNHFLSANTFNSYVHNVKMNPIPSDLKDVWDNLQSFFEQMWK